MGRILDKNLYPVDGNLSLDDYLIGSDADSVGKTTMNYELKGIFGTFQASLNLSSVSYTFSDATDPDLDETDAGYFTTNSNETSAPAVTQININKTEGNGQDISSLIAVIALQPTSFTLRLYKPSVVGQVFFFAISAIVDNTTHYSLTVSNFIGSNSLVDATTYSIVFDLSGVPSIYSETDPVFIASPAGGITAGNITNWNTAFGWGDHSVAGYLDTDQTTPQTVSNGAPTFAAGITTQHVLLDTGYISTGAEAQGSIFWNPDEETADLVCNGTVLQMGQETLYHARNNTLAIIADGKPVMATGTLGASGRITVALMNNDGSINPDYFIGIATEPIEIGGDGKVTAFGKVRGINTTGTPYGETWNDGDLIYLGAGSPGALTKTQPSAVGGTTYKAPIAIVIKAHATVGTLFVRVQGNQGIHEAHDVQLTAIANQDVLRWSTANLRWENYSSTNWDTAYSWGDHSAQGYITSFTETDPVFVASPAYGITNAAITEWDAAYQWGNHNLITPPFKETVSTGIISGGVISINGVDNTKFDIAAGKGYIVDHTVDPPTITTVSFGPFTSQTVTNLATKFSTDIAINSVGAIIQQDSFTDAERRQYIMLGGLDHSNKINILRAFQIQSPVAAPASSVQELSRALGDINIDGNTYVANGANLNINKTGGTVFSFGRGNTTSELEPHKVVTGSGTAISFGYVFDNGAGVGSFTALTTSIDPNNYDNGSGTLAAVPANRYTIQRFLYFPNGDTTFVQYGTTTYIRKQDAEAAVATISFPALNGIKTALVRGYLLVQQGETDLTSSNTEFYASNKFGSVIAGSSVTTFQGLTDTNFTALAKGDIAVFDGTEWVDLTVGANGTLLVADVAEATGVKWASGYVKADGTVPMTGTLTTRSLLPGDAADTIGNASNRYDNAYFDELTIGTGTAVDAILSFNADVTGNLAMQATTGILFWSGNTVWHDGNFPLNITAAAKGDILAFNGTDWVDLTVGANDSVLTADSAEVTGLKWATPVATLAGLTDTTITLAAKGDLLVYNGSAWVDLTVGSDTQVLTADSLEAAGVKWAAASGGATQLSELSDVVSATNTNRFVLVANGTTGYVGRALVEADISDLQSYYLASNPSGYTSNTGTVTSVAATVPTGISVSGSPITTSGTLAFTWTAGYQGYTTTEASKLAGIESGATADQVWGEITGTLASQTDLQSALDAKVDLAGDTMTGILVISPSTPNANPLRIDGTGDWSATTVSRSYITGRDTTGDDFWYIGCASDVNNDVILYSYPAAKWLGIRATGEIATTATAVDFTTAVVDVNDIRIDDISIWYVSSADAAHQRADARDDATNYARLHWYGVNDVGSTSNFRHAWYDGTNYVDIDYESDNLTWYAGANSLTFTIASQGDANLVVESDRDNVTETDNPTIQMWQDNATVKAIWGIEGSGGAAFSGAASNSPYFDTLGASGWYWAINGTSEMSLTATELDLGSNHLVVDGFTLENSTDRSGLLQITDSVTTRAYYGFQIKDDSGQLFSMMSNATVWGVYDDTNSKWGITYTAGSHIRLYYNASIKLETTNTGLTVTGTGVATDWQATSDARLKTEVLPLNQTAPQVEWKQFHVNGEDRMRYGVIAQDVIETHPELITVDDDGFMSLSYTDLLVLKMAEKDKQIEELTDRLDKLEGLVQLMMK